MSDTQQIYEGIKITGTLVGMRGPMQVWLWDCGPSKPVTPKRPPIPEILKKGKEGDAEYDLAKIEMAEALEEYQASLKRLKEDRIAYADWQKRYGGPIEVQFWSVDARDALSNDMRAVEEGRQEGRRWYLSSRTRGYEKLPNGGLPEGMAPGHGHRANLERQIAGEKEFIAALKADPVFGQEIRP